MVFSFEEVQYLLSEHYGLNAIISGLPGYDDLNFRVLSEKDFVFKISDENTDLEYLNYQCELLGHLSKEPGSESPEIIPAKSGRFLVSFEHQDRKYYCRLLSWMEGEMWSSYKHHYHEDYLDLGRIAGNITKKLTGFKHDYAKRVTPWDLAQADWVIENLSYFSEPQQPIIEQCYARYLAIKTPLSECRKGIIHNDINDYNVLIQNGKVDGIIDFGDAIYTQLINELAIALAYACMNVEDPLMAATFVVKGYHESFPLEEKELDLLYDLVITRLLISLASSAKNKVTAPDNTYLQVSDGPGWDLLLKWVKISDRLASYYFRNACGYTAIPTEKEVKTYLENDKVSLGDLLEFDKSINAAHIDFDINSSILGMPDSYNDPERHNFIIKDFLQRKGANIAYGGYGECRPFYITDAFKSVGLNGYKHRTIHLGEDYWCSAGTRIMAPLDGIVVLLKNNDFLKDYGPTVILKHITDTGTPFYTLYGHLASECLTRLSVGDEIEKGQWLASIGKSDENGDWAPHLHFQIILDLLDNKENFPGVWFPEEMDVWSSICPDPKHLIDLPKYASFDDRISMDDLLEKRNRILGPSLSISYDNPIHIVKGDGAFLVDSNGQKYLDLVNNVAHVGHEEPRVVIAARNQIAKLNTNTRYLHSSVLEYAESLLAKFPEEYTRVYFVNSGSEANELAIRMARTITTRKNMLAIEHGYHGNTNETVAVSSYKFDGKGGSGRPERTFLVPMPESKGQEQLDFYLGQVSSILTDLRASDNVPAAFIHESIMSCGGQIVLPDNYLNKIYELMKSDGGLCIADEIQTGFGRVGKKFWAYELYDLNPDIITLGKPIGNGHPIGAVVCKEEVALAFTNGMEFFSTFGGNPVSAEIGKAVLSVVEQDGLQEHANTLGHYFKSQLQELQTKHEIICDVRGEGLFLGFELRRDDMPAANEAHELVQRMRDCKILLSTDGPKHNVIKIKPPMCISKSDVTYVIHQLDKVLTCIT